jgi:hypothetical protein
MRVGQANFRSPLANFRDSQFRQPNKLITWSTGDYPSGALPGMRGHCIEYRDAGRGGNIGIT